MFWRRLPGPYNSRLFFSYGTRLEPGQVRFQDFWAHLLMWIESLSSNGKIYPFWFMSPCVFIKVYNLPVFDKFSDYLFQNSSLEIFCNIVIYFVVCGYLFKKLLLKDICLFDVHTIWYIKYSNYLFSNVAWRRDSSHFYLKLNEWGQSRGNMYAVTKFSSVCCEIHCLD